MIRTYNYEDTPEENREDAQNLRTLWEIITNSNLEPRTDFNIEIHEVKELSCIKLVTASGLKIRKLFISDNIEIYHQNQNNPCGQYLPKIPYLNSNYLRIFEQLVQELSSNEF